MLGRLPAFMAIHTQFGIRLKRKQSDIPKVQIAHWTILLCFVFLNSNTIFPILWKPMLDYEIVAVFFQNELMFPFCVFLAENEKM